MRCAQQLSRQHAVTGRVFAEWLLISLVFAAAGAWPTPDVNEAHYLAKARHADDPAWCAGDFFLESPEAHGLFFRLLAPLAAAVPLSTAAWIGRWAGWFLLAAGFRYAAAAVLPAGWRRLLAAVVFSLAIRSTTMAGEWLIGGCEAKVFAWAAVLAAWGEAVRGRWLASWLFAGAAAAFHPLVGGWMMIVIVPTAAAERWAAARGKAPAAPRGGLSQLTVVAGTAGGVALAAVGLVPAVMLTAGVPAAVTAEAARIYVVDRLPHHLLPRTFAEGLVTRHLLAVLLWAAVAAVLPGSPPYRRVITLTLASLAVSATGWLIGLGEAVAPELSWRLLRYYWFRLADGLLPLGLAVFAVAALCPLSTGGPIPGCWRRGLQAGLAVLLASDAVDQTGHWPLPGRQLAARSDKHVAAADWVEVCDWITRHTPADARFLTPRSAASFIWRAERPEVVAWKNIPQDPEGIIAWRQRILDCFSDSGSLRGMARSTVSLGRERLAEVARRYRADYVLAPRADVAESNVGIPPVYANDGYAVLKLSAGPQELLPDRGEPRSPAQGQAIPSR